MKHSITIALIWSATILGAMAMAVFGPEGAADTVLTILVVGIIGLILIGF